MKVRSNLTAGIVSIAFAVLLFAVMPFEVVDLSNKMIKADFLPRILGVIIGICGIYLVITSFIRPDSEKIVYIELKSEARVAIYAAALVLYLFLFERIGFFFSSELLAVFTLVFIKDRKWLHYVISVVYVALVFVVFRMALGIPMPTLIIH